VSTDELLSRLKRLHAAVGATNEFDLGKFGPKVSATGFYQDFTGGLAPEEIENLAHSAISHVAHLDNHLRRWAKANGKDLAIVRDEISKSGPLALLQDLANIEKHGPERGKGRSDKSPKLVEVERVLRLETGTKAGSGVFVTFHPTGPTVRASSGGTVSVVIDGRIVDQGGGTIADLHDTLSKAVEDLERLAQLLSVPLG
jgi:hypothetical protein